MQFKAFLVGLVALSPLACAGCCCPCGHQQASTGWMFQVGRPSTLNLSNPAILAQAPGPIGVQPLGSLAGFSDGVLHAPAPAVVRRAPLGCTPQTEPEMLTQRPRLAAPAPEAECTLQDVCKKLDRLIDGLLIKKPEEE